MNKGMIKKLPETVKKNGFCYDLIERDENRLIYAQKSHGLIIAYEVFKTRLSNPHPNATEDLKNYEKVESFPGNEEFGKRAWTYRTLEEAERRYQSLAKAS
jgi:hypothetical protein